MTLDLHQYSVRTDLAVESKEMISRGNSMILPGIEEHISDNEGIKITRLDVSNQASANKIGRIRGKYVTLEVPKLRNGDTKEDAPGRRTTCDSIC